MKKLTSALLAIMMVVSLSVPSFAADAAEAPATRPTSRVAVQSDLRETLNEPGLLVLSVEETVMDDGSNLVLQEVLAVPSIQPRGTSASAYMYHNWYDGSARVAIVELIANFDVAPGNVQVSNSSCDFFYDLFDTAVVVTPGTFSCTPNDPIIADLGKGRCATAKQKYTIKRSPTSRKISKTLSVRCYETLERTNASTDETFN